MVAMNAWRGGGSMRDDHERVPPRSEGRLPTIGNHRRDRRTAAQTSRRNDHARWAGYTTARRTVFPASARAGVTGLVLAGASQGTVRIGPGAGQ